MSRKLLERRIYRLLSRDSEGVNGLGSNPFAYQNSVLQAQAEKQNLAMKIAENIGGATDASVKIAQQLLSNTGTKSLGQEASENTAKLAAIKSQQAVDAANAQAAVARAQADADKASSDAFVAKAQADAAATKALLDAETAKLNYQTQAQTIANKQATDDAKAAQKEARRQQKLADQSAARTQTLKDEADKITSQQQAVQAAQTLQQSGLLTANTPIPVAATQIVRQQLADQGVGTNSPDAQKAVADYVTAGAGVSGNWWMLAGVAALGIYLFAGRKKRGK